MFFRVLILFVAHFPDEHTFIQLVVCSGRNNLRSPTLRFVLLDFVWSLGAVFIDLFFFSRFFGPTYLLCGVHSETWARKSLGGDGVFVYQYAQSLSSHCKSLEDAGGAHSRKSAQS